MGISAGPDHTTFDGQKFHLETKTNYIAVWGEHELTCFMRLSAKTARELARDLELHAMLLEPEDSL